VTNAVSTVAAHAKLLTNLQAKISKLESALNLSGGSSFLHVSEMSHSLSGLKALYQRLANTGHVSRSDKQSATQLIDQADVMVSMIQAEAKLI